MSDAVPNESKKLRTPWTRREQRWWTGEHAQRATTVHTLVAVRRGHSEAGHRRGMTATPSLTKSGVQLFKRATAAGGAGTSARRRGRGCLHPRHGAERSEARVQRVRCVGWRTPWTRREQRWWAGEDA